MLRGAYFRLPRTSATRSKNGSPKGPRRSAPRREKSLLRLARWRKRIASGVPLLSCWRRRRFLKSCPRFPRGVRRTWPQPALCVRPRIRRWRTSTAAWHPSGQRRSRNCGRLKKSCAYFLTNRSGFRRASISLHPRRIRAIPNLAAHAMGRHSGCFVSSLSMCLPSTGLLLRRPWNRPVCWTRG